MQWVAVEVGNREENSISACSIRLSVVHTGLEVVGFEEKGSKCKWGSISPRLGPGKPCPLLSLQLASCGQILLALSLRSAGGEGWAGGLHEIPGFSSFQVRTRREEDREVSRTRKERQNCGKGKSKEGSKVGKEYGET